jgi:polyphosphate kinase
MAESAEPRFLNRELSWVEFNRRVLDKALDRELPLLERLKFLSNFSTNLDEFFMIRVSGLMDQIEADPDVLSPDGLTSTAQLQLIAERLRPMLQSQSTCLLEDILPGLERAGIRIVSHNDLITEQRAALREYFDERVFPILTPLSVDPRVEHLHFSVRCDLHVRRFQIPMDDSFLVRRLQGFADLFRNLKRFINRDRSAFYALREGFSTNQFHDQEFPAAGFFQSINRGNVGIIQRCQQTGFPSNRATRSLS